MNDPAVVLADEPTGNLDTRTSVEILALLQRLNRDGLTIILVTHEPDVAAHAGRILTFRDGRLLGDEPMAAPVDAAAELDGMEEEAVASRSGRVPGSRSGRSGSTSSEAR